MSAAVSASVRVMHDSVEELESWEVREGEVAWGRVVQLSQEKEKLGAAETRAARTAKMPAMPM